MDAMNAGHVRRRVLSAGQELLDATSMVDVLCSRAAATPDDLAVCFLIDGEEEGPRLSYAGLDKTARALAAVLRDAAEPGDRILLLFESGLEFVAAFFGCLYAGLVPVPLPPPHPLAQTWQGLANVTADCQPRAALTTSDLVASLIPGFGHLPRGQALQWIAVDQIDLGHARRWRSERRRCPPGTVGEIWVAGLSVAAGYWNRPDENARTFAARLSGSNEGPFLRSGDLGFLADGELFITGRIKDSLVVRGRNHYPQDIETSVQRVHPGLRGDCGAVFESGPDGEPRLIVAQELDRRYRDADLTKLAGDIRQSVTMVVIFTDLEAWLGRRLHENPLHEHPTIASLARFLADSVAGVKGRQ